MVGLGQIHFFDELDHSLIGLQAHVEVPVGREDNPVVTALYEVLPRNGIGQLEPRTTCRRASRLETVERLDDRLFLVARSRLEREPGRGSRNLSAR